MVNSQLTTFRAARPRTRCRRGAYGRQRNPIWITIVNLHKPAPVLI